MLTYMVIGQIGDADKTYELSFHFDPRHTGTIGIYLTKVISKNVH